MDNGLHQSIIESFNYIGYLVNKGLETQARNMLIISSECEAVGLGTSKNKKDYELV